MPFRSVLFEQAEASPTIAEAPEPPFFRDLNLDQIVATVVAGREEYDLMPFLVSPLSDVDVINYRHEVFQDLQRPEVHQLVSDFADRKLVAQFRYRSKELREDDQGLNHYQRLRFFLNAVEEYCETVNRLTSGLTAVTVRSRGLRGLRDHLNDYVNSGSFVALQAEARRLEAELGSIHYVLSIKGNRITVGPYDQEVDYGERVTATFHRFQVQDGAGDLPHSRDWETYAATGVLNLVAQVYPDLFAALNRFCVENASYLDHTIAVFDRDIQFYLSCLDYIRPLRESGLVFGYPQMSTETKDEQVLDTFDLALATKLTSQHTRVVCNDITLTGAERILVISGPNNGGKTTLARAFGQLHYLARLGWPVPGHDVRLFLCDQIFTHFEREEDITTLTGKLQDELDRLRTDFQRATPASVIVLNEVFNSTTAQDALFLSRQILERVSTLDALAACVTFLDELSSLNDKTVSMVSTVMPDDPATRTHKVIRTAADGRAYARAIADKYGLSFTHLVEEITR